LEQFLCKTEIDRKALSELTYKYCFKFLKSVDYGDEDGKLKLKFKK
jgi:hypothetical protein